MNTIASETNRSSFFDQNIDKTNVESKIFDAVIIGGGMVGGLMALLLKDTANCLLIEANSPVNQSLEKKDPRVLAINEASRQVYRHAGVWQKLKRQMPYLGMQVWNENGRGQIEFGEVNQHQVDASPFAGLGSMVEPKVLVAAIEERLLEEKSKVQTLFGTKVTQLSNKEGLWHIELSTGEVYQTPFIIGADGAQSFVKRMLNIKDKELDYQQIALTCAVKTTLPHYQIARQVFWPDGPVGILPMSVNHMAEDDADRWSSIVWSASASTAKQMLDKDDDAFARTLSQMMQYSLGKIEKIESRAAFPLKARAPDTDSGEGWVVIGDAAHVIHPLAGQGVNLGVMDAAVLADHLITEKMRTGHLGHYQTLRKYSMARKVHTRATMHAMSLIGWFQRNRHPLMVWSRGEGTQLLQKLPILRKKLTEIASGMSVLRQTKYYNGTMS